MKKVISVASVLCLFVCMLLVGMSASALGESFTGSVCQTNPDGSVSVGHDGYFSQSVLTKFSQGESAKLTVSMDELGTDWYAGGFSILVNEQLQNTMDPVVWKETGAAGLFVYSFEQNSGNMVGRIYRYGVGNASTAAADWAVASLSGDVTIEVKQNDGGVTALYLNGAEWVPHTSSGLSIPDGYLAIVTSAGSKVTVKESKAAVNTAAKTLDSIEVKENPTKTVYTVGETLDLSNLKINAVYTDTSKAEVLNYVTLPANGAVLNTEGQQTVTVSYTEGGITKTTSLEVTVETPGTFAYYSQQTATKFSQGQSAYITMSVDRLGTDWFSTGLTLVVNPTLQDAFSTEIWQTTGANGVFTYSFQANGANEMVGMIYRFGEGTGSTAAADWATASLAGDVKVEVKQNASGVTALYLNGAEWVPHESSGFAIPDGYLAIVTTPGAKIQVKDSQAAIGGFVKALDALEIKENPTKTAYTKGETLDLTGLKVNAVYNDVSKQEVSNYTVSLENGSVLNTVGQQTITVTYTEDGIVKTATFTVTVSDVTIDDEEDDDDDSGIQEDIAIPETGENTVVGLYVVLAVLSLAVLVIAVVSKKKVRAN